MRCIAQMLCFILLADHCSVHVLGFCLGGGGGVSGVSLRREVRVVANPFMLAKKKGGGGGKKKKGGGGNQKQSGFAWAQNFELKPTEAAALRELAEQTAQAYKTRTGRDLHRDLASAQDVPKSLWAIPKAVLILREEGGSVVCAYANPAACETYGFPAKDGYKSLIDKPLDELAAQLADGSKFESGYSKKVAVRCAETGEPISVTLVDADRWSVEKMAIVDGKLGTEKLGVAYSWSSWELADGTICKPGGERIELEIDPDEAQAAVDAQAALVRKLKEEDGLENGEPAVKEAVAELLRLKSLAPN